MTTTTRLFSLLLLALLVAACGGEKDSQSAVPLTVGATPLEAAPAGENLLAASAGASVVVSPGEYGPKWAVANILDGDPATGWASGEGSITAQSIVIESPEKIRLDAVVIDTSQIDGDGRGASSVTLEVSDLNRNGAFQKVADIALQPRATQAFSIQQPVPGRWLRITVHGNHGDPGFVELMDVAGYGEKLTNILGQPSLVSFSAGATVIRKPSEHNREWSALLMIDENPESGWASKEGELGGHETVIALPERTELSHVIFDTGSIDGDGRGAKDVTVEVSDSNAFAGFQPIASVSLDDRRDRQVFAVSNKIPGRWVKLTVNNNHGAKDYTELMEFRGVGAQVSVTPFRDVSGTYATEYGDMHLRQEGTFVSGCYEHDEGLIVGGVEGRVMKLSWRESGDEVGPAIMVFSPDGKRLNGLWWFEGREAERPGFWDADRIAEEVGKCWHWSGDMSADLIRDLEEFGRARVYGINFDVNADVIKDESKPTLDKIASIMKLRPKWKMTVEGHTDATGGAEYNLGLSERRAQAVVHYLESQGIDPTRLTAVGLGMSQPVASNDTPLGQSQNRRVEMKKE